MVQAKLKNLRTGSSFEHRFRAADSIEQASMETHDLEFLYQGGDTYHFMNTENYDQLEMDEEALGDNAQWMQPGMKIQAEFYDGRPIGIQLPNSLTLEIVETAPVMKTATKTASTKPAKLENGVTVNVPEFVGDGRQGSRESGDGRVHGAREGLSASRRALRSGRAVDIGGAADYNPSSLAAVGSAREPAQVGGDHGGCSSIG